MMTENSTDSASHLFRDEAIEHHFRYADAGSLLDPAPMWTSSVLLVSAAMVIAAVFFLALAEIDLTARIDGVVRIDSGQAHVVAPIADQYLPYVHAGDRVRIQQRAFNNHSVDNGFGNGVVIRIVPRPVPTTECTPSSGPPDGSSSLEIALSPVPSGPFAIGRLRAGSPVSFHIKLKKQRLFDIALGSPLRER